jgi:hypothetical protein
VWPGGFTIDPYSMEVELKKFTAELRQVPGMNAACFNLPFNPIEVYGKRHMIKVRATIDLLLSKKKNPSDK